MAQIIEAMLEKNPYPELNQEIYDYLIKAGLNDKEKAVEELEEIINIYSCFCKNLVLLDLDQ